MNADHVFEDLSDGEQQGGSGQIDCRQFRMRANQLRSGKACKHTHWPKFTQYPNHQDGFQYVKRHKANEREKLVQHIEGDIAIMVCFRGRELARPVESRVQGDIARTDEENQGGGKD